MLPEWLITATVSDYMLLIFAAGVLWFTLDYGLGSPWWRGPIGYVVLAYSLSVLALMFLIIWGIVAGERVDEWVRQIVGVTLIGGIVGKIVILRVSRREGKIESRRRAAAEAELGSENPNKEKTP